MKFVFNKNYWSVIISKNTMNHDALIWFYNWKWLQARILTSIIIRQEGIQAYFQIQKYICILPLYVDILTYSSSWK